LSTINPAWPDLDLNLGRRGGKQPTNRLSYDTALQTALVVELTIVVIKETHVLEFTSNDLELRDLLNSKYCKAIKIKKVKTTIYVGQEVTH
jgi:hypothetical protein